MAHIQYKPGAIKYALTPLTLMFTTFGIIFITFIFAPQYVFGVGFFLSMITSVTYMAIAKYEAYLKVKTCQKSVKIINAVISGLWAFLTALLSSCVYNQNTLLGWAVITIISFVATYQFYTSFGQSICKNFSQDI
ncbi:MAG: hypothetical protein ACI9TY_001450 [Alphaproteobacteria bacterium]|jgi:hypothetical protein